MQLIFLGAILLIVVRGVDPYLVLQLPQDATEKEVQDKYKKLVQKLKKKKSNDLLRKLYEEAYKEIILANILNEPQTPDNIKPDLNQQNYKRPLEIKKKIVP